MPVASPPLRDFAIRTWQAGVHAVDAERLVRQHVTVAGPSLTVAGHPFSLQKTGRVCVLGAGKAGAGMAAGVEAALAGTGWEERLSGWVNVPEDCLRPLRRIRLHGARPGGVNEPTPAGVEETREILRQAAALRPEDLCLVLISGGGSALLPAPVNGISLEEKLAATRLLAQAGATIQELNALRKSISRIKGGGLARACNAGTLIALIISDVIGDPLEVIASGPTVLTPIDPSLPAEVLRKFDPDQSAIAPSIHARVEMLAHQPPHESPPRCRVENHIIGNNALAIHACAEKARSLGIDDVRIVGVDQAGTAVEIGRALAHDCQVLRGASSELQKEPRLTCLLSGGEPVVSLAKTDRPRKGGRNQEVVLAALCELWSDTHGVESLAILSGGTDGEDGPTDAAGAVLDHEIVQNARTLQLNPFDFLAINNSYPFFHQCGGLLKTGPTHTNVMDVRVALVRHPGSEAADHSPPPAQNPGS